MMSAVGRRHFDRRDVSAVLARAVVIEFIRVIKPNAAVMRYGIKAVENAVEDLLAADLVVCRLHFDRRVCQQYWYERRWLNLCG